MFDMIVTRSSIGLDNSIPEIMGFVVALIVFLVINKLQSKIINRFDKIRFRDLNEMYVHVNLILSSCACALMVWLSGYEITIL